MAADWSDLWSSTAASQLGGEPWLAVDADFAVSQWNATLWALGRYLLPILGLLCLAGVAVNVLQIGFLFLPQRLAVDFARLDPLQGLRRIFSAASMVHLGFGIVKLAIVLARWRAWCSTASARRCSG